MNDPKRYPEANDEKAELHDADPFDPLASDPVIEVYKKHVDRTILRENLKLSPQERSEKFLAFMESIWQLRDAAEKSRRS